MIQLAHGDGCGAAVASLLPRDVDGLETSRRGPVAHLAGEVGAPAFQTARIDDRARVGESGGDIRDTRGEPVHRHGPELHARGVVSDLPCGVIAPAVERTARPDGAAVARADV